jgi:tetratricopeptide (TPR) repeat protein
MSEQAHEQALAELTTYLEQYPDSELAMEAHKMKGQIYRRTGNEEAAQEEFKTTEGLIETRLAKAQSDDEKVVLTMALADLYQHQNRIEESKQKYRQVIDEFPDNNYRPMAMGLLAEALYANGDVESALNTLAQIYERYRGTPAANNAFQRAEQIRNARRGDALSTGTQTMPLPSPEDAPTTATEENAPAEPAADETSEP